MRKAKTRVVRSGLFSVRLAISQIFIHINLIRATIAEICGNCSITSV